jgi:hypothetical protein
MARNIIKQVSTPIDEPLTSSVITNPEPPVMPVDDVIHDLIPPAREEEPVEDDTPRARRYIVVGGPDSVVYAGCRTPLRRGKEVSDAHTDIAVLEKQGVVFQEIK